MTATFWPRTLPGNRSQRVFGTQQPRRQRPAAAVLQHLLPGRAGNVAGRLCVELIDAARQPGLRKIDGQPHFVVVDTYASDRRPRRNPPHPSGNPLHATESGTSSPASTGTDQHGPPIKGWNSGWPGLERGTKQSSSLKPRQPGLPSEAQSSPSHPSFGPQFVRRVLSGRDDGPRNTSWANSRFLL